MGAADPASGVGYDGGGGGSDLLASGSVAGDRGGDGGSWIRARVLVLIFFFFSIFLFPHTGGLSIRIKKFMIFADPSTPHAKISFNRTKKSLL